MANYFCEDKYVESTKAYCKANGLICLADVAPTFTNWLWYPYIPFGKVTIVMGDPGEGKTTLMVNIAAALTRGEPFGDADESYYDPQAENAHMIPLAVLYESAEDGLADTIKPRFLYAKADMDRIYCNDETRDPIGAITDGRLRDIIMMTNAKLVILDPIQAYLGAGVDMNRANEIRPVMSYLSNIADEFGCAIVLIGHMNKCSGIKAAYKALGSIDFIAAARSVLLVGRNKSDDDMRVMCHIKSSLAPMGHSKGFRIKQGEPIEFLGDVNVSADEIANGMERTPSAVEEAEDFLKDLLSCGEPVLSRDIEERAKESGIKYSALRRARKSLGVNCKKIGKLFYYTYDKC